MRYASCVMTFFFKEPNEGRLLACAPLRDEPICNYYDPTNKCFSPDAPVRPSVLASEAMHAWYSVLVCIADMSRGAIAMPRADVQVRLYVLWI